MNAYARLTPLILAGTLLATTAPAETTFSETHVQEIAELRELGTPGVERFEEAIYFIPPEIEGFRVMNVRIYSAQGELLLTLRSFGEIIDLTLEDLPDGTYEYESVAVVDPISDPEEGAESVSARSFGRFSVNDGRISDDDTASIRSALPLRWLGSLMGLLASDAHAANLEASSSAPTIGLNDTDTVQNPEWELNGNNGSGGLKLFKIRTNSGFGFTDVITLTSGNTSNAMQVRTDGEINFRNSEFSMEPGAQFGIGTGNPAYPLHISDSNPRIYLFDEANSTNMNLQYTAEKFVIEGDSFQNIVQIDKDAPANSFQIGANGTSGFGSDLGIGTSSPLAPLHISNPSPAIRMQDTSSGAGFIDFRLFTHRLIFEGVNGQDLANFDDRAPSFSFWLDQSGDIALGTTVPQAPLHVWRSNGAEQMLFLENVTPGGAQDRAMMRLSNPGGIRFQFDNTSLATSWRFQAATGAKDKFEVTKVGTGEIEFAIDGNGNAVLAGNLSQNSDRNAKTGIEAVDPMSILAKVTNLPIANWRYKDSEHVTHIGPMAQDFRAAFGTGASDTSISTIDTGGVALAAIQALAAENALLKNELSAMKAALGEFRELLVEMKTGQTGTPAP